VTLLEAAGRLCCPPGTVASRLARARDLLARRLSRYSLVLSVAALSGALMPTPVPAALLASTFRAAVAVAAGGTLTAAAVPSSVAALTEGVLKTMWVAKLRSVGGVLALLALAVLGAAALAYQGLAPGEPSPAQPPAGIQPDHNLQLQGKMKFRVKDLQLKGDGAALKGKGTLKGKGGFIIRFETVPPLPAGPMPLQALARLALDGQVVVKLSGVAVRPAIKFDPAGGEVGGTYVTAPLRVTHRFPRRQVRAFDARGKPVPAAEVTRRLRTWQRVLVSQDGKEVDPLHLKMFQEGVLILVLPRKVGAPVVFSPDEDTPP
jgi:hypothetical protein